VRGLKYFIRSSFGLLVAVGFSALLLAPVGLAQAVVNPQSGSIGLQGTIEGPPPTQAPTITTPAGGQSFSTNPITIAGLCVSGLLVKIFDNNVFIGSAECTSGSFSIKASLFNGTNSLVGQLYDALDQAGPDSAAVSVSFSNAQFAGLGPLLSLTSSFAKRGANPGQQLTWPISISGGTGPYALSIDWGDGTGNQLLSEAFSGSVTLAHTYNTAGTYTITIQATDKNGETAFLQLVGVASGAPGQSTASSSSNSTTKTITKIVWWPIAVMLPLILIAFWLGRRHEIYILRKRLEHTEQ
jgi:hypothetical protein